MKLSSILLTLHLLLFTILALPLCAQPSERSFADCNTLQSVIFESGDVLAIQCDTVYVLNKLTFRRYDSAYKDLRRKGTSIANLMNTYDEIIGLQEKRIREQEDSYARLRQSFDKLSVETQSQIGHSANRLSRALTSLEALNSDLTETKKLLTEAREIIESEQRGLNLEKILWGAGGLIVGFVVAGVVN